LLATLFAILCAACAPIDVSAPTNQPPADNPPVAESEEPDPAPPQLAPLQLALAVHLEGWPLKNKEMFDGYVAKIRAYSDLTHEHGAVFTWETANLIDASVKYDDNILYELQAVRGDGVGVHADLGGNPNKPGHSLEQFTNEMAAMKDGMELLGVNTRHVSGICSDLDWVTAAIDAGFEATTGTVEYCLKSLPESLQPDDILSCTNPSQCHDPYPSDPADRLVPWRAADGASWINPDPDGGLALFHSAGSLPCLAEHADTADSPTKCEWNQLDVDQAIIELDQAIALRQPGQMNHLVFVWSFGQAIDAELLAQLLSRIQDRVAAGDVQWKTMPDLIDGFTEWESLQ